MGRRQAGTWATGLVTAAMALLGCQSLPPVAQTQSVAPREAALRRVAVFPLRASEAVIAQAAAAGSHGPLVARSVGNMLAQDLLAQGVDVVTPTAIEGAGLGGSDPAAPLLDPVSAASEAARRFHASAILMGTLQRWRDRTGTAATSPPAGVAFGVTLYEAPSGRRLWTGRFDQTQHAANVRPLEAARYPGGGARWLSANELAQWGAEEMVKALVGDD